MAERAVEGPVINNESLHGRNSTPNPSLPNALDKKLTPAEVRSRIVLSTILVGVFAVQCINDFSRHLDPENLKSLLTGEDYTFESKRGGGRHPEEGE